jgi:UDP-N-acetylglucosamine acyltransferase
MPANIHPTAIIEPAAELGRDVEIGPYAYVGGRTVIGDGTRLHHHASVEGRTTLGKNCEVFPYACIGGKSQDLKFKGGNPGVRIGDRNVFREYVTVHAATADGEMTTVGSDNMILAYCHIAHDCVFGSHIIMSNYAGLAGHVTVEDHATVGGLSGVHPFTRVGAFAYIGGCTKVTQDVPPYVIVDGVPAVARAANVIGMRRAGIDAEGRRQAQEAFRILFRSGLATAAGVARLREELGDGAVGRRMVTFIEGSKRGIVGAGASADNEGAELSERVQ